MSTGNDKCLGIYGATKKTVFPHARELNFRQGGGPLGGSSEVLRRARGRCTTPRAWTPGFEPAGTCGCLFFPV